MTLSVVDGLCAGGGPLLVPLALLLTDILTSLMMSSAGWRWLIGSSVHS